MLPAKMPKRMEVLRDILGPPPYPEELLRPPGLKADGGLGDVRYSTAHHDQENLRTTTTNGGTRGELPAQSAPPFSHVICMGALQPACSP
jgi:hypothetical protein